MIFLTHLKFDEILKEIISEVKKNECIHAQHEHSSKREGSGHSILTVIHICSSA